MEIVVFFIGSFALLVLLVFLLGKDKGEVHEQRIAMLRNVLIDIKELDTEGSEYKLSVRKLAEWGLRHDY
jgi:hypothetical protein